MSGTKTPLFAVVRRIPSNLSGVEPEIRYLVFKSLSKPNGVTWTASIAKASRWMNAADARSICEDVREEHNIMDHLRVEGV